MPFYRMPDGEQLFVLEYGQGQPVLVLSGLGMLSWQWKAFLYAHQKNFRFILPEWRGFGASSRCKIPVDDAWAFGLFGSRHQEFIDILQQLSALLAQYQQVELIRDLDTSVRKQIAALWLKFIQLQNEQKYSLKAFAFILNQPRLQSLLLPSSRVDYMAWYINNYLYHREDYREALVQLSCPVTFFSGVQSKLYPLEGQRLIAESLPQAKQVFFSKSGHTPLLTEPLKFARELGIFLKENSQSSTSAA